jgi:phthalate 4,5-dioxygenase
MLTPEDNELLCRVGPGTPMGNLLRRYWLPALLSSEVPEPDSPPVRMRLLGEDLVSFRDSNGDTGLFAQACPHRGASLFFGRNEEAGLRCVYHGWKFDTTGACVDMPSEPAESNFKTKVRVAAYPTHESGGIIWTYMGPPEKMQPFRNLGSDDVPADRWRASRVISYCNWMQGLEGNVDSTHISYLHSSNTPANPRAFPDGDETDRPGYPSLPMRSYIHRSVGDPELEVHDTWYGFRYAGIRATPNGYLDVRVSDFIMPGFVYVPQPYLPVGGDSCIMMIPRDDDSYWRWGVDMKPRIRDTQMDSGKYDVPSFGPGTRNAGLGGGVLARTQWADNDYLIDREDQRTNTYSGIQGIAQQDLAVTESMGAIMDRTHEHLGASDKAIIRARRMLISAAKDLANGIEPPAVDASLPYTEIRSAERSIAVDDDWRLLGTEADPIVQDLRAVAQ